MTSIFNIQIKTKKGWIQYCKTPIFEQADLIRCHLILKGYDVRIV